MQCTQNNVSREAQTMILVDHPNVLKSHCSFVNEHNLWVVMPYMSGGSCLHILKAAHPDGFEEVVIATILKEVLKGLEYLHHHGHIHRDVKAGNILIDSRGAVKLGDFGVSACLFDSGDRQRTRNTFVGTPCWYIHSLPLPHCNNSSAFHSFFVSSTFCGFITGWHPRSWSNSTATTSSLFSSLSYLII